MQKETQEEREIRCKRDYSYTVEKLIEKLKLYPGDTKVFVGSDEELNSVHWGIGIGPLDNAYDESDGVIIFPLSGLEVD